MNVLITGAGGFVGSHLVDSALSAGHYVRAVDLHLDRLAHVVDHRGLEPVAGDITDQGLLPRLVDGIQVVYHLASAHLDVRLSDAVYRRVNVGATQDLLAEAQAAGVSRFVHVSSVGVIGDVGDHPADEGSPCGPTNIYERTKLEGERAALQFWAETGFPIVVARPAWVYGPRCPRTYKLIRTIARQWFPLFGDGHTLRHPIYVSDLVRGLQLCAERSNAVGQAYILAGAEVVTIDELVGLIAELSGRPSPAVHLPAQLGHVGGYVLEIAFGLVGRPPPFSRRSMDFYLKNNAYDISKARHELGFDPQVDLRSGLLRTLQSLSDERIEPHG
jgi:nucleoside-diphosphate-sugar epimerase